VANLRIVAGAAAVEDADDRGEPGERDGHLGERLEKIRLRSPSLLRTWEPPLAEAEGLRLLGVRRLGKRIVWEMEGDLYLVFHLMIAGRPIPLTSHHTELYEKWH